MMQTTIIEGYELSPQQRRLWRLQHGAGGFAAQSVLLLEGAVRPEALREAACALVCRHEILRTFFRRVPGVLMPVQSVEEECDPHWRDEDLSGVEPARRPGAVEEFLRDEGRRPFDLENGPVLRASLVRLEPDRHLLVFGLPAVCADERTLSNLFAEFVRCYDACTGGVYAVEEAMPYVQFSAWQNDLLEGEEAEAGADFWRRQDLSDVQARTLPSFAEERAEAGFSPESLALDVTERLSERVAAAATARGTTEPLFLLACWQTLLWRLTGRPEVVVGQAFDGREYEMLEGALGLFSRTLPVRCRFAAGMGFGEVLSQLKESAGEAAEWQDFYTWGDEGETGATPFFPLAFEYAERPARRRAGGVAFSIQSQRSYTERFDMKLFCARSGGRLMAELRYDASRFGAKDAGRLGGQFLALLEGAVADAGAAVEDLNVLSEAERLLLYEWNETAEDYDRGVCLDELFERQAARTPDATALVFGEERLTYGELNLRADRLAQHLRSLGVRPETLVGICMERSAEMVVALLGVLKAGGAYLPLDPAYPAERIAFMLHDSSVSVLLTQSALAEDLPTEGVRVVYADGEWAASGGEPAPGRHGRALPENLAYVIYTSGSTGRPKGVMVQHRSVVNLARALSLTVYGRYASPLNVSLNAPLSFDASVKQLVQLLSGHALHVLPEELRLNPEQMLSYVERRGLNVLDCTPSQLGPLLAAGLKTKGAGALSVLLVGGEPLDAATWKLVAEDCPADAFNVYGPTECTVDATACRVRETPGRPTIGRPLANTRVYLLDGKLRPVPAGAPGEMFIGGEGLARGYLNAPCLTAEKFIPDPFSAEPGARLYRTGDLARFRPDGQIEFIGRADNQLKVRGHRVEPGEIEAALCEHASVRVAAVAAREDEAGERRLVAYVVTAARGSEVPAGALREHLRARLPEYMVPSYFVGLDALPLSPNGKVDRRALPAPDAAGRKAGAKYVAPRSEVEQVIAEAWREVLQVERVGVDDNFFDLGGHSLLVVQAHGRLREALGRDFSIVEMFRHPTVGALAGRLSGAPARTSLAEKVQSRAERRRVAARRSQTMKGTREVS